MADPIHILIVDDSREDRTAIRRLLQRSGDQPYVIHEAEHGQAGLAIARSTEIACILLDFKLPDMDGLHFLGSLRIAEDGLPTIPVLMLTGMGSEQIAVKSLKAGATDYLAKSNLSTISLDLVIRQALAHTAMRLELVRQRRELRSLNDQLARSHADLERLVAERTAQLSATIAQLRAEVAHHERTQAELRERERSLRFQAGVLDQVRDAVVIVDGSERIIFWNRAAEQLYGYTAAEAIGRSLQQINRYRWLSPEDEQAASASLAATGAWRGEVIHFSRDGRRMVVEASVVTRSDGTGATGMIAILRDVSERKAAEERVRLLESVVVNSNDAVIITAADTIDPPGPTIVFVNQAFERITGYTAAESIGETPRLLQGPDTDRLTLDRIRASLRDWGPVRTEVLNYRKDGTPFWADLTIVPLKNPDGWVTHWVAVQRDISERKQAEQALLEERRLLSIRVEERTAELRCANEALARAARLKDEFLANMSHELRTPLNNILGRAELLSDSFYGPLTDAQRRSVESIGESGRHLLALINDILDLAKIEAGALPLASDQVQVLGLCESSVRMVSQVAYAKQLRLKTSIDDRVQMITGDARRLRQILVNLLSNAVKFTPPGGSVGLEVAGDAAARMVSFIVWDTGIGIDPRDQERLFKPFVQLDSTLSREYEGTGLGLVLVAQLARLHGGDVRVESAPGRGSRFTVQLPWTLGQPSADAGRQPLPAAAPTGLKPFATPPKVLLAEDNPANIALLGEYLDALGCVVHVARTGAEVVAAAASHRPDLILMDIQLPGVDGLEATRQIRAEPALAQVPIIAITALAMPGDRERCLSAGVNDYLTKPLSLSQLTSLMRDYLRV